MTPSSAGYVSLHHAHLNGGMYSELITVTALVLTTCILDTVMFYDVLGSQARGTGLLGKSMQTQA